MNGDPMHAVLDGPNVAARDTLGMFDATAGAVGAFEAALAAARAADIPFPPDAARDVVLCGMGGSAIAGDLLIGALWERLRKPVQSVRGYGLPGWAGESTLVVASSFSGTTEETLTCTMDAVDRTCPTVAISTGGKMVDHYRPQGVPVVEPPGAPMPRAACVQMVAALVVVLERFGVVEAIDADLADARERLALAVAAYAPDVPARANPAKQLAARLHGTLPMIWGAESTAAVAYRWKCQINENPNMPAFWAAFPEHNHNEIVGVEGFGDLGVPTQVVMLRDPRQHRQVERRFDTARELIEPHVGGVTAVMAEGASPLGRMLDLVLLGDYVSLYMAMLRGVDPGPVAMIDRLKAGLAKTGYGRMPGPTDP